MPLVNLEINDIGVLRAMMLSPAGRQRISMETNVGKKTMAEFDALAGTVPPVRMTPIQKLANAVLLFHGGGEWTEQDRARWRQYTGFDEATTKTLCDFARSLLEGPREQRDPDGHRRADL